MAEVAVEGFPRAQLQLFRAAGICLKSFAAIQLAPAAASPADDSEAAGQRFKSAGRLHSSTMPKFVIEREIPGAGSLTELQIREVSVRSLQALKEIGTQIQWLHSYVTEDKVYCVYLAPNEDIIREHARKAGLPADRISAVRRLIDPTNGE